MVMKGGLPLGLVEQAWCRDKRELEGQMRNRFGMNIGQSGEPPEILARLQQGCQHQATRIATGFGADEGVVRPHQTISGTQFLKRQTLPRAWIGGTINGGHQVSRKGSAEAGVKSE
jgi:hypothetical protein